MNTIEEREVLLENLSNYVDSIDLNTDKLDRSIRGIVMDLF